MRNGWRSGFVVTAIGLIMWVGSLAAAFCLYPYAVRPITHFVPGLGVRTLPVAFLLAMPPPEAHSNWLNRLLGILPGSINGVVAAAVIALVFMTLPLSARLAEQLRRSGSRSECRPFLSPDLEQEMLQLVNRERARRGIAPLVAVTVLRMVGQAGGGRSLRADAGGAYPFHDRGGKFGAGSDAVDSAYGSDAFSRASCQHPQSRVSSRWHWDR